MSMGLRLMFFLSGGPALKDWNDSGKEIIVSAQEYFEIPKNTTCDGKCRLKCYHIRKKVYVNYSQTSVDTR